MNRELKVEDYIRTKKGWIAKIVNINDFREPSMKYGVEASYLKDIGFIGDEDIKISSPNIIDLIEVGDYVNGRLVFDINGTLFAQEIGALEDIIIKSVVTHEQFESMEYRVESEVN